MPESFFTRAVQQADCRLRLQVRHLLPDTVEELRPAGWEHQLQSANPLRPFSLKHARQQASIVGHMQRLGLAPLNSAPAAATDSTDVVRCRCTTVLQSLGCLCSYSKPARQKLQVIW